MIDLYFWPTPNCYKVAILLEELGEPYRIMPIHIGKGEQMAPEFLAINPNNKVPAIVDQDGPGGSPLTLFESGAILLYLSEKADGAFLGKDLRKRALVTQWLMFQMGGVGPMLGQAHYFRKYAPRPIEEAIERYTSEARRLYGVLDRRLGEAEYLAGDYSLADMATYPWIRPYRMQGQDLADFPNIQRWYSAMHDRPAVARAIGLMKERMERNRKPIEGKAWNTLFGDTQFKERRG